MISAETACRIWECYREISCAEKILKDMGDVGEQYKGDKNARTLSDAFGRQRDLQLGVPSGDSAHRLFGVSPKLAESVIRAHISEKQRQLIEANEQARIELNS